MLRLFLTTVPAAQEACAMDTGVCVHTVRALVILHCSAGAPAAQKAVDLTLARTVASSAWARLAQARPPLLWFSKTARVLASPAEQPLCY